MRPNLLHLKATSPSDEDTRMLVTLLDSSSSSMSGGGAGNGKPTVEERGDSDGSVVACTSIALTQPNDLETVNLMDTTAVQHLLSCCSPYCLARLFWPLLMLSSPFDPLYSLAGFNTCFVILLADANACVAC